MPVAHDVAAHFLVALLPSQLEKAGIDARKLLFAVHVRDEHSAWVRQPLAQLSSFGLAELFLVQHGRCFPQRQAPTMEKSERIEDAPVRYINLRGADVPQRLRQSVDRVRPRSRRSVADQMDSVLVGDEQTPAAGDGNRQRRRARAHAAVDSPAGFCQGDRHEKVRPGPQQHGVVDRAARPGGGQHLCPRNRHCNQSEPQRLPRRRAPQPRQQQHAGCRQPGKRGGAHGTCRTAHLHRPRLPARFRLRRRYAAAVLACDVTEQAAAVQTAAQHVQFVPEVSKLLFGADSKGRRRLPDIEPHERPGAQHEAKHRFGHVPPTEVPPDDIPQHDGGGDAHRGQRPHKQRLVPQCQSEEEPAAAQPPPGSGPIKTDQRAQPGQGQQVLERHRAPVKDRGKQKRRVRGKKCGGKGCRSGSRHGPCEPEESDDGDNTHDQDGKAHRPG